MRKLVSNVVGLLEGLWFCRLCALVWFVLGLAYYREHIWLEGTLALALMGHQLRYVALQEGRR